ncbi:MAG TPA: extracellular solute-binding protein [Candidatus Omnitrophota bacterium]|nr:extracellular solute-binding protein [Candidatus Omnitrophota bacterium]
MKRLVLLVLVFSLSFCFGCCKATQERKKVITIWHWMTDREESFQELAKQYEAKTGIKVNFELYAPSEQYSQKVRAAAQGKSLPDIFGILSEKKDFSSFIKSGHVANLTSYLKADNGKWEKEFFTKALAVNEFKPDNSYGVVAGFYGVPIDVMTIEMLYNKKLFKKAGLNPDVPPATWGEFIAAIEKLKASNIQGLVSGWGEVWMIDCLASNYAFNIMGEKKVLDTIKGEVAYTDPDWIKVLELFAQMRDNKALVTGVITMINKTAEQLFANEKCAFAFNGSWCVNVYKGMNPDLDYGVMLPPAASDKYPMMVWGGAGSSFVVNDRSPNKEMAIEFLKWLTDRDQQVFLANKTSNLPANKDALAGIPPILAQFADDMDYTTHPSIWGISEFPVVTEALDKGIQSIIIGEKTPQSVAAEVQKIKERELARKK